MNSRALLSVLFVALAISLVIVVRQHLLVEELDRLGGEVASLQEQLAEVARHVSEVEQAVDNEGAARALRRSITPLLLQPGIYVLAPASTDGEPTADADGYTIYHVVATVAIDDFEQGIQFGAARSSLFTWQFYFDYDDDGRVDTDMMREFVDSLPFGGYLSRSFDTEESQRIYDRFVRSSSEAEYTPLDRIPEEGGAMGRQLWSFIVTSSEEMATWIKGALEPESRFSRQPGLEAPQP